MHCPILSSYIYRKVRLFLLVLVLISDGFFFQDHELIEMFWEVLKSLSSDNQKKFLKLVPLLPSLANKCFSCIFFEMRRRAAHRNILERREHHILQEGRNLQCRNPKITHTLKAKKQPRYLTRPH
jgi:hypothetical protein